MGLNSFTIGRGGIFRAVPLWLGLAALMVQALAPLCMSGAMAAAGRGVSSIVLCTSHGFQTIRLDASGTPVPNSPPANEPVCPMCLAFQNASSVLPPAPIPIAILQFRNDPIVLANVAVRAPRAFVSYVTRGPPATAVTG